MRSTGKSSLAAALAIAALGAGGMFHGSMKPPAKGPEARGVSARPSAQTNVVSPEQRGDARRALRYRATSATWHRHPNGPGWTNRQVQRMASKRRNVIKNRKAQR